MNFRNILFISLSSIVLFGCNSSSNNSTAAVSGLSLPANVEVISDDASTAANLADINMAAYNSTGSDYSNLKTEYWINAGQWQEPLKMADMLVCIMGASAHKDLANHTYQGLIDMNICQSDSGDQSAKTANFADVVSITSRASNTSNQTASSWFTNAYDENDDGDTLDAGESMEFATEIVISEGVSTSNPFGVFSMNWNKDNSAAGDHSRGSLVFTDNSTTKVGISFLEENKNQNEGYEFDQWAKGELNKDGSGGMIQVKQVDNGTEYVYKINFNATHANIDKAGTATCTNLDESTMTTYIDRYNLYNATTGALVDINAGLEFVHGASKDKRGYAGSYFDHNGAEKHWMWVEDGSAPSTIYSESNPATSYSVSWSSGVPTISGITFDQPIRITADYLGAFSGTGSLVKSGSGTLGRASDDIDNGTFNFGDL